MKMGAKNVKDSAQTNKKTKVKKTREHRDTRCFNVENLNGKNHVESTNSKHITIR